VIVTLNVSSFTNIAPGVAVHVYGKLVSPAGDAVELRRPLTAEDARALNIKDGWDGHKAGQMTQRWNTRDALHAEAVRVWKDHFTNGILLIVGDDTNPRQVLAGPSEWKDKLNELWREFESIGGWSGDDTARARELCGEWNGYTEGI
jgi:hypothetical protein